MIIQNLKDVPSKDPCQLCQCVDGAVVWATQECPAPTSDDCQALPTKEGQCCPEYQCEAQEITTETEEAVTEAQEKIKVPAPKAKYLFDHA